MDDQLYSGDSSEDPGSVSRAEWERRYAHGSRGTGSPYLGVAIEEDELGNGCRTRVYMFIATQLPIRLMQLLVGSPASPS